ncbi:MAG: hypothetical protein NTZ03_02610 [Actinobacteria bacterium]|nr:hypothetical protein [Actinomycetota bacterium]
MCHATELQPRDHRALLEALGTVFVTDIHSTRFEQRCPAAVGGCFVVDDALELQAMIAEHFTVKPDE